MKWYTLDENMRSLLLGGLAGLGIVGFITLIGILNKYLSQGF